MFRYENNGKGGLFREVFNETTGLYVRGEVLDGPRKGKDPFMRAFPGLMDIGIMGHCSHGMSGLCAASGIQCYQNGLNQVQENMSLSNYKAIIDEAEGKCFQVALGGRGDPDMHEDFEALLKYTREHNIIPNFTTSGLGMTKEKAAMCKKYCGAVAVSMYSRLADIIAEVAVRESPTPRIYQSEDDLPVKFTLAGYNPKCIWDAPMYIMGGKCYSWDELHHVPFGVSQNYEYIKIYNEAHSDKNYTFQAIDLLLDAGVTTNIHFVLSKSTIREAIIRLKYGGFPRGINAVVFLLHKPIGQGQVNEILDIRDPEVHEFFSLVDNYQGPFQIGFDSCTVPAILNLCRNIDPDSLDSCEAARFSMYITCDMKALPCSFDNVDQKWAYDLNGHSIQDAWDSPVFDSFRQSHCTQCSGCNKQEECHGGCPIVRDIVLCEEVDKTR